MAATAATGSIAGVFADDSVSGWYNALRHPAFVPPTWVFVPVWVILYALMGLAAWRVWRADHPSGTAALMFFGVQLGLNALWPGLFFELHSPGLAFLEIVVLWGAVGATVLRFWQVDRPAGAMLVPYWAWVSFAVVLNYSFWILNV